MPVRRGGWAGNGLIVGLGIAAYELHKAHPDLIGPEHTLRALDHLFGCDPGSNLSFVSAVGARSKAVAYGSNRADFSFIAGGVVPGVLIIEPDFPENKAD
jgi:endoglucanase